MAVVQRVTQDFRQLESSGGRLSDLRRATSLAFEYRRKIREGDLSYFFLPLILAFAKDGLIDPVSNIPVAGLVITLALGFPVTVFLFIFMWGRGKMKLRLIIFLLSILDLIPVISLLPFNTISVIYGLHLAKKEAKESQKNLDKLAKHMTKAEKQADQQLRMEEEQMRRAETQMVAENQTKIRASEEQDDKKDMDMRKPLY